MCVAARASERHAEEHGSQCLDTIEVVLHLELSRDRSALAGSWVQPDITGGGKVFEGRIRQEIAGNLFCDELVQWEVVVKRADHPVAVRVDASSVVEVQTVRVAVPNGIKPIPRLVFAKAGTVEQHGDELLIAGFPVGLEKLLQLRGFRGEARQDEGGTPSQSGLVCVGSELPVGFLQSLADESVDRVPRRRRIGFPRCDECPVFRVLAALFDPAG